MGQNIELRCKAGGRPRPLITWLHNGMEVSWYLLPSPPPVSFLFSPSLYPPPSLCFFLSILSLLPPQLMTEGCVTINATAGSLSVCNTTALSGGRYSCLAQNLAGSVEFSVPVTVIPDFPVAPVIINRTQTSIIMAGEPLILDCIVSGSPRPSVTWLKDGVSWYRYYRATNILCIFSPLLTPSSPSSPSLSIHPSPSSFSLSSGGPKLYMSRRTAWELQSG